MDLNKQQQYHVIITQHKKNLHNTEKILVLIKYGYDYDNRQTVIIINKQKSLKETNPESLLWSGKLEFKLR